MSIASAAFKVLRDPGAIRNYLHWVGFSIDPEGTRISKWSFGKLPRKYVSDLFPEIVGVDIELTGSYRRKIGMSLDILEICILCSLATYINAN